MRQLTTRFTAFLLAVVLLIAAAPSALAAQPEAAELYRILNAAEIMTYDESGSFDQGGTLTRAQLAKILVSCSEHRGQAGDSSRISPFSDVSFLHWGAPYIAVARDAGLMRGYTDGSFKPDQPVLYEEAVVAVLNLLGYSSDDYTGVYPQGPVAKAGSLKLLDSVAGSVGANMTRGGMASLIYNALDQVPKGGSRRQAELLGYSVSTGGLALSDVTADNTVGPVTYDGVHGLATYGLSDPLVYRNGGLSAEGQLQPYDILYYSATANTVWAYSSKRSGTLDAVQPNREAPTAILLSGSSLALSTAAARSAVGTGGLELGSIVTALLDRDGNVADVVSAAALGSDMVGLVTDAGAKALTGETTTSAHYLTVALLDGSEVDVALKSDRSDLLGKPVRIQYSNGQPQITGVNDNSVYGAVSSTRRTIGSSKLSADVQILDVDEYGNSAAVALERLNGLELRTTQVHAVTYNTSGEVNGLILNAVTGDTFSYGILQSVRESESKTETKLGDVLSQSLSVTGSYSYDIGGVAGSASTNGSAFSVEEGPSRFSFDGSTLNGIRNLTKLEGKIESVNAAQLTLSTGATAKLSGTVAVYDNSGAKLRYSSIDELMSSGAKSFSAYYDKPQSEGGLIRVIYYQ